MDIAPLPQHDRQVVLGYGRGGFNVSDREWRGAIIVLPTQTLIWPIADPASLVFADFDLVRESTSPPIELLLIGTGPRLALLPSALRTALRQSGLAIDVMDTGAACRTYNVLVAEERRVAAALIPIG